MKSRKWIVIGSLIAFVLALAANVILAESKDVPGGCYVYTRKNGDYWDGRISCNGTKYFVESYMRSWGSSVGDNPLKEEERLNSYNSQTSPIVDITEIYGEGGAIYVTRHTQQDGITIPQRRDWTSHPTSGLYSTQTCWKKGFGTGIACP